MLRSKITSKSQTTLPKPLRIALDVGPGDEVGYILENGRAIMVKANAEEQDTALEAFLDLLKKDIATRPERLQGLSRGLVERVNALTGGEAVDLNETIYGEVSL